MVVTYYTQPYYLDAALETIKAIKKDVKLYVIIELTHDSKISTILNIPSINTFHPIEKFYDVIEPDLKKYFELYFDGVAGVFFITFSNKKAFSYNTLINNFILYKFLKSLNTKIIHFDSFTLRSLFLLPFLFKKTIITTIHDVIPHSGENSWKVTFLNFIYTKLSTCFLFYSKYSHNQFINKYPNINKQKFIIRLLPYNFNKLFVDHSFNTEYILFFGRISYYKGIDIFLEAIPHVLKFYPNQIFLIAGKSEKYKVNNNWISKYDKNIILVDKYHSPKDTVELFKKSKIIVCPYRDSTQSGVLMTALALNKITIASDTGSFSEYIINNFNGIITKTTPIALASCIIDLLNNNKYLLLEKNNYNSIANKDYNNNRLTLQKIYNNY